MEDVEQNEVDGEGMGGVEGMKLNMEDVFRSSSVDVGRIGTLHGGRTLNALGSQTCASSAVPHQTESGGDLSISNTPSQSLYKAECLVD